MADWSALIEEARERYKKEFADRPDVLKVLLDSLDGNTRPPNITSIRCLNCGHFIGKYWGIPLKACVKFDCPKCSLVTHLHGSMNTGKTDA